MAERLARRDNIALLLTKLALALILLGFAIVKRRPDAWPVAPWTMYSRHANRVPPALTSEVELRIIDASGTIHRLLPTDLIPRGRRTVIIRAIEEAFDPAISPELRNAQRQYLAGIIARRFPDQGRIAIEGWRMEWIVQPLELPPLDFANPARVAQFGRFDVIVADGQARVAP